MEYEMSKGILLLSYYTLLYPTVPYLLDINVFLDISCFVDILSRSMMHFIRYVCVCVCLCVCVCVWVWVWVWVCVSICMSVYV